MVGGDTILVEVVIFTEKIGKRGWDLYLLVQSGLGREGCWGWFVMNIGHTSPGPGNQYLVTRHLVIRNPD